MKNTLVALMIGLTFSAHGQMQDGQTCLFTCIKHLDPIKSVDQLIRNFHQLTHPRQNVYTDGAIGTIREVAQFIGSEVHTKNLNGTSITGALDSGYVEK